MKIIILLDPHNCLIQVALLMINIYMLLILMLLTYADGVDHIWCMIVYDDYHGLVYIVDPCYKCHVYQLM